MISAMEDAMKSCIPYFKPIIGSYINDEMSVYAAQASFFMILAVFPFFMLLLSLIDCIPMLQESDLLEGVVDLLPDNLDPLAITIIHDVEHSASPALLSVSALAASGSIDSSFRLYFGMIEPSSLLP